MRKLSLSIVVVAAVVAAFLLGQHHPGRNREARTQTGSPGRHILYYVDPMHPSYKSGQPGIAPDCGMTLEPVFAEAAASPKPIADPMPTGAVSIDAATQRMLGIELVPVKRSSATRVIQVVGRVIPEDTKIYKVNSGVDGFIRDTYNDAVGTLVKKDQKLATYYAPDFIAAASGFLAANERVPGSVAKEGTRSIQNYTDRLRNLGMSDGQIKHLADARQLPETIDVVSPADGVILARSISAGQHFAHDMDFYTIADLSRVWVAAEISQAESACLHPGQLATLMLPDKRSRLNARITESLPQSEAGGSTVKLRLEVENPRLTLRPEMLVDVELPVRMTPAVTVPLDALIDSGHSTRVYVEHGEGLFEPRTVQTGWRFNDQVEILAGIQPGERVVASATFLVDSESRLKRAASTPAAAPVSRSSINAPSGAQHQGS